ncbi:MGDG synthase family glycosyltransferase [Effusibacillus pohliae]|uniref:MGDG synthase family glycosyltransferase n=1 Tax=Effusibacillus pohliae TaxID=232270 RepID=UPI0003703BFC|nr:glycosyltransferase [Effusibacillus pohliae]
MPHIVLLSESIGTGHERAACAIEEALLSAYPNVHVTRLNLLDTFRPRTAKVTRTLYLETLAHRPGWWGKWYEWQREKRINRFGRFIVYTVLRKDVIAWLRRLAPDAVVCTHPLPACLLAEMKRKGFSIPLCTVLTDFDLHGYWTHPGIDLYCTPVQTVAEALGERLKGSSEVRVTGIPIANSFVERLSGPTPGLFAPAKRVLIMGGGLGIGLLPMVERIIESDGGHEITVISGYNRSLRRELRNRHGNRANLRILGYTRQVAELMATSDLLVTKPGGLTIAEALAMKLPMVLYTPIPGQERRNGQLMSELGVAVTVGTPEEGAEQVRDLLENDSRRQNMRQQMESVRRPFAAAEVAEAVMEKALQHSPRHIPIRMASQR